jgi:hypothetical protein
MVNNRNLVWSSKRKFSLKRLIPSLCIMYNLVSLLSCMTPDTTVMAEPEYPDWFYAPPGGEGVFFGIGSGDELPGAQQSAIVDIGQQFSTTVQSVLTSKLDQDHDDVSHISNHVTAYQVTGARIIDQFQDTRGRYWVLAQAPLDCMLDITEGVLISYKLEYRQEAEDVLQLIEKLEQETVEKNQWFYKPEYVVGDTGPAGGIVFYENPDYALHGWRYLEAWAHDEPGPLYQWKANETPSPGTLTIIGSGYSNTYTALQGGDHLAAEAARNAGHGGHEDWFLPSKDELNLMYQNLYKMGAGDLKHGPYWSSTQYYAYYAWAQDFSDGKQDFDFMYSSYRVRLVRAF